MGEGGDGGETKRIKRAGRLAREGALLRLYHARSLRASARSSLDEAYRGALRRPSACYTPSSLHRVFAHSRGLMSFGAAILASSGRPEIRDTSVFAAD